MEVLFLFLFIPMVTKLYSCVDIDWIDGYASEDHPGLTVEYTYYKDKKTWNEANSWCQGIGGSLAKIDSISVLDAIVHSFWDTYSEDVFYRDYWIGLTEVTEGQYRWSSDCSGLAWSNNYIDPWDDGKQCFKVKKGNHYGERDTCSDMHAFLCQRYLNQGCVMQKPSPIYRYETYHANNDSNCDDICNNNTNCIATVFDGVNNCTILTRNGPGNTYNFHVKNCVSVNWVEENVDPPLNISATPNINCGAVSTTSTSSTTSTTTTTTPTTTTTTTTATTTTSSTSTSTLVLATCTTPVYLNISDAEILSIAREISKNLNIDAKKTSAFIRRLTSAEDKRSSSTAVGYVGIVFIAILLSILVISDLVTVIFTFRRNIHEILNSWGLNNIVIVLQIEEPEDNLGQHSYV